MRVKLFITVIIICLSMAFTGCTSLNTHYQCPMMPGVHCKSLDQINRMVLAGQLGQEQPIPVNAILVSPSHSPNVF